MKKIVCLVLVLMLAVPFFAMAEEKPVLLVGTNAEFAPFEFVGDDGEFDGFDMALMAAICEKLGYEMQVVNMEFDSLIPSLQSGKIDVAIAAITMTEERAKSVDFSDNYFEAHQKLIVLEGSEFTTVAEGMKVGVQSGTTGDLYVSEVLGEASEDVFRYAKALDAVIDLANGRLDAVVVDEGPAAAYTAGYDNMVLLDVEDTDVEQYAIAISKDKAGLVDAINGALAELIEDGTYDAIYTEKFVNSFTASDAE